MKTIKVIDLFNKIANGEEVPKKIKYGGYIYERFERLDNKYNYKNGAGDYFEEDWFITNILNNEVEIIEDTPEEDKKIKKMNFCYKVADEMQNANNERFRYFINEIIDKVNGEDNE